MSVLQTPATIYTKVLDTSDDGVLVGRFSPNESGDIQYIQLAMCFFASVGSPFSTDSLKLKILTNNNHTSITSATALAESSSVLVTSATTSDKWYGLVRFDFSGQPLHKNSYYYLYLIAENYTRSGDTRFISYVIDNVQPIYMDSTVTDLSKYSGQFILYMYQ